MKTARIADVENSYVPEDYEDLYTYYIVGRSGGSSLCKTLIRNYLPFSDDGERESLLHDVFLRLFQHNMLERFDPAKSNFGGVIFFVTRTIVVNYLDRRTRNPITGLKKGSIENSGPSEDFEPGVIQLDQIFSVAPTATETDIDRSRRLERLMDYARNCFHNPQSHRDRKLLDLLKLLLEGHEPKDCAAPLGVTPSTIYNWITHLRGVVL